MTSLAADWLSDHRTQAVFAALDPGGGQVLFVGGCVRNALLDMPVSDLDLATDLLPQQVSALAEAADLKTVPTGIDHGTVTIIADHRPYEVTTFRRDVSTDGRRATVAFTDRIEEDAGRRDFTMNALYARQDGVVVDPLGGLSDLNARRVRFIGDPDARIAEDGLRILRFFRFHATHGDPHQGLDPEGMAAIARDLDLLSPVSRERIGEEVRKLLSAWDPAPSLAGMAATGVLARILPGADAKAMAPLVHLETELGVPPSWRRRLRALGDADWFEGLRLSRADGRHLNLVSTALQTDLSPREVAYRHGAEVATDLVLLTAAVQGAVPPADWRSQIDAAAVATFPIIAADLMDRVEPGPALGNLLATLEDRWIASGFRLGKAELLAMTFDSTPMD